MPATVNVVKDRRLYVDGFDLSGVVFQQELSVGYEEVDAIVSNDTARVSVPGLQTVSLVHEGYISEGATGADAVLKARAGDSGVVCTSSPQTAADGEVGYFLNASGYQYDQSINMGELPGFEFRVGPSNSVGLVRGTIMTDARSAKTATGNGTARQLGAVASAESLYAAMHVVAASGTTPTLDMIVESDDNSGITSGVTRITFTQEVAVGAQYATAVAGPITDDWWRVGWTIGGTGPSFTVIVTVGIQ